MPRQPRANQEGIKFHHIMVQGINKAYIFENDILITKYIELMMKYSEEMEIRIIAYCIMNNHVHILLRSEDILKMSKMMQKINTLYARYYNFIKGRVGYVFRNRYLSQPITSDIQLVNCVKYIHDNPVKAKMVNKPSEYKYSNYNEFYNKSNLKEMKKLVGIDFAVVNKTTKYIDGEFIELDINVKEYILGCIVRFCSQNEIKTCEIFSNVYILRKLIKSLKEEYKVNYIQIMEIMNIPQNIMIKLKK